jgi:hypothetical protein
MGGGGDGLGTGPEFRWCGSDGSRTAGGRRPGALALAASSRLIV